MIFQPNLYDYMFQPLIFQGVLPCPVKKRSLKKHTQPQSHSNTCVSISA